jgi:tetratricopeptide (TPR) repeat protein
LRYLKLIALLLFIAALSVDSWAVISVSSNVNKNSLRVGDSFIFTLQFSGLPSPIPQPFLPQMDGAIIKGQYQSSETSPGGESFLYHYIISPVKSGKISLSDFTVRVENQTIKVGGFTISVDEAAPEAIAPRRTETVPSKDDVFLEGRLSKEDAFEGEVVIYSLHLLTRESIRNFEYNQKSEFDGFRKVELPSSLFPPTAKVTRNSRIFLDATILKCVLFPLKSGALQISPFVADIRMQSQNGGSTPTIRLRGGDSKIRVNPLPSAPQDFRGAIGSFTCAYMNTNIKEAKVGEPLAVDISFKGTGSLPGEAFFTLKSPFFSSYPPKSDDRSQEKNDSFIVDRICHLSFVPLVAGTRTLPDINFVYFDPAEKKFRNGGLKGFPVVIQEALKNEGVGRPEILPLLPVTNSSKPSEPMTASQGFTILLMPFLLALSVYILSAFLEKLFLSPEKRRLRALTLKALREFKEARSNLDARKGNVFHAHLRKSLEAVLEIRAGESVSSLTVVELREKLKEKGVGDAEAENLVSFAEEIDSAAFSNELPQKTDLRKKLERMRGLIKKKKRKSFAVSLVMLFAFILFAEGQNSILTEKASDEYSKGNYEEALKYYKIVEDSGAASAELYYNTGNAYFESGRLPQAILYYKKTLKLSPALAPAKNNLALAKNLLPAKASPFEPSPLEGFLLSNSSDLFFYLAFALFLASNLIFSCLRLFNLYFAKTMYSRIALVCLFMGLAAASMFFLSIKTRSSFREGVVLESADVFQKPDPSLKPLANLPEGSEVYILQSSELWSRVKWGEGEGWAYTGKVGIP